MPVRLRNISKVANAHSAFSALLPNILTVQSRKGLEFRSVIFIDLLP